MPEYRIVPDLSQRQLKPIHAGDYKGYYTAWCECNNEQLLFTGPGDVDRCRVCGREYRLEIRLYVREGSQQS